MNTESKAASMPVIFYITDKGNLLAKKIAGFLPGAEIIKFNSEKFGRSWSDTNKIICIMAAAIVVRAVAPLLKDKKTDPAVIVLDEKGKNVISLLSGHIGGANKLAEEVAGFLGAEAVITTASDVQGRIALDIWAMENNLHIEDFSKLKHLSMKIVNGHKIKVRSDYSYNADNVPDEFVMVDAGEKAEMVIAEKAIDEDELLLRPKNLFAGIGCNRGTSKEEIEETVEVIFASEGLSMFSVKSIASIDLKYDEKGLVGFANDRKLNIDFFTKDELNNIAVKYNITASDAVKAATGAVAVAEPAAMLAAGKRFDKIKLLIPKQKRGNVTLAIAEAEFTL